MQQGRAEHHASACFRHRRTAEQAQKELEACRAEEQRLEGVLQELRGKVQTLRGDLQSQQTQSGVMKAIGDACTRGELSGVHGRLGAWLLAGPTAQ
jgi:phage shock protein A